MRYSGLKYDCVEFRQHIDVVYEAKTKRITIPLYISNCTIGILRRRKTVSHYDVTKSIAECGFHYGFQSPSLFFPRLIMSPLLITPLLQAIH